MSKNLNRVVLDTGTTKTVRGRDIIEHHVELLPKHLKDKVSRRKENRVFRFGDKTKCQSNEEVIGQPPP